MINLPDFNEISENFGFLDDWEDRYRYLIELGQLLPALDEAEKTDASRVQGCVSQVWLQVEEAEQSGEQVLRFRGDSDAMIVKGLVAVLISIYSNSPPAQITKTNAIEILDQLGLREHLTSQRSNGLIAMVQRIQSEAQARL